MREKSTGNPEKVRKSRPKCKKTGQPSGCPAGRCLLCGLFLQRLAGLEDGDGGSGDLDGFLGFGVAAHAGFALLRLKTAEANQLDLVALAQCVSDGVKGGGDGLLGVLLGNAAFLGDFRDQFGLIHV